MDIVHSKNEKQLLDRYKSFISNETAKKKYPNYIVYVGRYSLETPKRVGHMFQEASPGES